jgi:hypothetical protein
MDFLELGNAKFLNKTVNWFGFDTESSFNKNIKTLNHLKIPYDNITYSFNSHGFRTPEFGQQPSIIFLGCSNTLGVGVKKEKTFSYIVSKEIGLIECNLAVGGSSNDVAFRLLKKWFNKLNPKLVIWLKTYQDRFELIDGNNILKIKATDEYYNDFYKIWINNEINQELQKERNTLAIRQLCKNLPLLELDIIDIKFIDVARDLSHPGEQTHELISKIILSKIDKLDNEFIVKE